MIERVLLTSCEHQTYRRAGNLAMLDFFGYPIGMIDVVWGLHFDYHSIDEIFDSFESLGAPYVRHRKFDPQGKSHKWSLSAKEIKMRGVAEILESGKNTVLLEDDHFLIMEKDVLSEKLENLQAAIDTEIGIVQLQHRGDIINDLPQTPIVGAEDFMQGSIQDSHAALFITPYGAEKALEFLRNPKTRLSLEVSLPRELAREDWLFSTIEPQNFVYPSRTLQGDAIGVKVALDPEITHRTNVKSAEHRLSIIEKFKL